MSRRKRLSAVAAHVPEKIVAAEPSKAITSLALGRRVPAANVLYSAQAQYSEITFGRLTSILERADRGDTTEWADLAERMIRTDSHLASVYESRLAPVAGARWDLSPGAGDQDAAKLAVEDCRAMLNALPELEQIFYTILHAIGVGYSVHEIVWTLKDGLVVPSCVDWLHPRRFRFSNTYELYLYDDGRAYGYAEPHQRVTDAGASGMRLSPNKYIVHTPRIIPGYTPSSGLLQTVARQWWVSAWVTKYWLGGAEVAGNPRIIGSYPQNATAVAKQELLNALESLAADGIVTKSKDVDLDILAPLAQGSSSVWSELLDRMDASKSKAILGSNLNTEIQANGSKAAAESQFSATLLPRAERDARALWSTIERDLFRPFLEFNKDRYGGQLPPIPQGKFLLFEDPPTINPLAVNAGAVTVNELRSSMGLPPWSAEKGGDRIADISINQTSPIPSKSEVPEKPETPAPESQPDAGTADVAEAANVEKAADAALNGAQVASLMQIVQSVAAGQIPRESGIAMITAAFPLSKEKAEAIMGPVGTPAFTPKVIP